MANRDDRSSDEGMQGGGYAGAQGRNGEGHTSDRSGAELQGGSYGRGWGEGSASGAGERSSMTAGEARDEVRRERAQRDPAPNAANVSADTVRRDLEGEITDEGESEDRVSTDTPNLRGEDVVEP